MLGLGETEPELFQTMDDLRESGAGVDHGPISAARLRNICRWSNIHARRFEFYGEIARAKGFEHVASGPLVRSSYHAADFHPVVR
jgi:lipoic acid synthetase